MTPARVRAFRMRVLAHYGKHGRDLPWRKRPTAYRVLVSEIMLQQTQVDRVIGKYAAFLAAFPGFAALARAPRATLLRLWSGLGYNRRALALQELAKTVLRDHCGRLPADPEALLALPGIGRYTAGAVLAFAFNKPVVFLDTNIRRVFLHEFFPDRDQVPDNELLPLIERTLDRTDPRTWYNALMDYGSVLKQQHANPNRRSAHYTRQSPFADSNRQVRGAILRVLVQEAPLTEREIAKRTGLDPARVKALLPQLAAEGFLVKTGRYYSI